MNFLKIFTTQHFAIKFNIHYVFWIVIALIGFVPINLSAQTIRDDFEGNGNVTTWRGDDCEIDISFANPVKSGINTSNTVLLYNDMGGQYANVRFDTENNFDMVLNHTFTLKIYVPSSSITGNSPNQVSLKLQDGTMERPWETQSEIIKPIQLNQWQIVTFDFKNDAFINLNAGSSPPTFRKDFNRLVLQVNGENNNDRVIAYIDDFYYFYDDTSSVVYDHLVWSDEFDVDGAVNPDKWHHQTLIPQGDSWFNGEVQHYTNRKENSVVEDGILKIIARRENFRDQGVTKSYTSARLNSKFAFTYGKVQIRAKLPSGVGTWPALWTLGKNITERGGYWWEQGFGTTSWPACGEIDIMEHWGNNQNFVQSAMHTPSSFGNTINHGGQILPTASTAFHIYTLEWSPQRMIFSVDDKVHYIYEPEVKNNDTWPFDTEQYILMNFAIQPTIYAGFTQDALEIDYIRIYQQSPVSSVLDLEKLNSILYPNPVDDQFTIKMSDDIKKSIPIQIYDISGNIVLNQNYNLMGNTLTIDRVGQLKSGVYFVSFKEKDQSKVIKFLKN